MSRFKKKYQDIARPSLAKKFGITNMMEIPKITKVVVNVGAGEAVQNPKCMEFITKDLTKITGQKPVITKAKQSIASFKLREGMPIGVMVTLRGERMFDFCDRLVSVAIPRVRDFKGISRSAFDGKGNYTLSIKEQIVFPEIEFDKTDKVRGLAITFVTTAKNNEQCLALLQELGFFFR